MKQNLLPRPLFITSIALLALITAFLFYHIYNSRPKIAYVRTLELVYGYNGMKQAHADFKAQKDIWQSNIDTLRINYQRSLAKYQQDHNTLSAKEKQDQETTLKRMENDLNNYAAVIQEEAQTREKTMTDAVLNQINSYVEDYAKNKGYDLILGAEGSGSIMYAAEAYDVTSEVLTAINKEYKLPTGDSLAHN